MKRTPLKRTPFRRKPTTDPITPLDRAIVLARSGGRCEWANLDMERCTNPAVHLHHKLLRRHGDHSPENLMHVCAAHHDWIHRNVAESYQLGYLRRQPATPPPPMADDWPGGLGSDALDA